MAKTEQPRLGGVVLAGRTVRLEPLRLEHLPSLVELASDETLWAWYRVDLSRPGAMEARVNEQLAAFDRAAKAAYVVVMQASGAVVGSTGFNEIDHVNRATEIGATWYARDAWGTDVNPECKLLLMRHAFEDWGALRVWLKTDSENARSRAAIEKLGAKAEGVLRWHMVRRDGSMRDSAVYSVIQPEWPAVKARLEARLGSSPA